MGILSVRRSLFLVFSSMRSRSFSAGCSQRIFSLAHFWSTGIKATSSLSSIISSPFSRSVALRLPWCPTLMTDVRFRRSSAVTVSFTRVPMVHRSLCQESQLPTWASPTNRRTLCGCDSMSSKASTRLIPSWYNLVTSYEASTH